MNPTADDPIVRPDKSPERGRFDSQPIADLVKEFKGDTPWRAISLAAGQDEDFLYRFVRDLKRTPESSISTIADTLGCPEWRVWEAFAHAFGRPYGAPYDYPGVTDLANRYKHLADLSADHQRALLIFADLLPWFSVDQLPKLEKVLRELARLDGSFILELILPMLKAHNVKPPNANDGEPRR